MDIGKFGIENPIFIASIIFFCSISIGRRLRKRLFPYMYHASGTTITSLKDAIMLTLCQLGPWFYGTVGVWLASYFIELPLIATQLISILFTVIVIAQLGQGLVRVILQLSKEQYFNNQPTYNFTLLSIFVKVIFRGIILLLILTNLGIKITPLLASLGVLGIAVSFALQSILEDLFASVSIYLDKPFRIGDYITLGEDGGTVEFVGIKTTRIRTILGEELVIANRKLTESTIHNYGKIDTRTITNEIIVSFTTSPTQQTQITNLVKQSCEFTELIDFQWCHLTEIGAYGLQYKWRYTLHSSDYNTYLQIQEKVLMSVMEKLQREGISIEKKFNAF